MKLEDLTFEHCPIIDCGVTGNQAIFKSTHDLILYILTLLND